VKILITGGDGYKGSVLIKKLLKEGYQVFNYDNQWFGSYNKCHPSLKSYKCDIRDIDNISMEGIDAVIHLANIANDPSVDLNPTLSWEVNVLAGQRLIEKACKNNVKQFIYASSGSVYGIKEEEKVTEELDLIPISTYNKTKMIAERVFLSYKDRINVVCLRPATVCGLSPRMRLDVAVNLLTFQALSIGKINVLGGSQIRPNIHIDDITDLYLYIIQNSSLFESGFYNAGFENISILEIAKIINSKIKCEIIIKPSNDPRSYRQDSTKILEKGFKPKKSVEKAIIEIINSYQKGELKDMPQWHTVNWMKGNQFK
tara:strand:- start:5712 stop:6656 length:945 start_codon:yes stop_codon:yes gene_type:complete